MRGRKETKEDPDDGPKEGGTGDNKSKNHLPRRRNIASGGTTDGVWTYDPSVRVLNGGNKTGTR